MAARRPVLFFSVFVAAALIFHEPIRSTTLFIIRAPFVLASMLVNTILTLPRLPGLTEEHAALEAELTRRAVELAEAREALRHLAAAEALQGAAGSSQGIVASVIGRSPIPGQETVLLNRGREHGLRPESVLAASMICLSLTARTLPGVNSSRTTAR